MKAVESFRKSFGTPKEVQIIFSIFKVIEDHSFSKYAKFYEN